MPDFRARGEAPGFCVGESVPVWEGDTAQAVSIPGTERVHLQAAVPPTPAKALQTCTWGPLALRRMSFFLSAFFSGQLCQLEGTAAVSLGHASPGRDPHAAVPFLSY